MNARSTIAQPITRYVLYLGMVAMFASVRIIIVGILMWNVYVSIILLQFSKVFTLSIKKKMLSLALMCARDNFKLIVSKKN